MEVVKCLQKVVPDHFLHARCVALLGRLKSRNLGAQIFGEQYKYRHFSNRTCIEPERQLIFGPFGLPATAAKLNSDCCSLHVLLAETP